MTAKAEQYKILKEILQMQEGDKNNHDTSGKNKSH
jgi:hypothetical protein